MTNAFMVCNEKYRELDTAYMYCGGKTEQILGEMRKDLPIIKEAKLATKINPWDKKNFGEASIKEQVNFRLISEKLLIILLKRQSSSILIS